MRSNVIRVVFDQPGTTHTITESSDPAPASDYKEYFAWLPMHNHNCLRNLYRPGILRLYLARGHLRGIAAALSILGAGGGFTLIRSSFFHFDLEFVEELPIGPFGDDFIRAALGHPNFME